jgi:hypothetical protein
LQQSYRTGICPAGKSSIPCSKTCDAQAFLSRKKTNTAQKKCFEFADSLFGFRRGMPQCNHAILDEAQFSHFAACSVVGVWFASGRGEAKG